MILTSAFNITDLAYYPFMIMILANEISVREETILQHDNLLTTFQNFGSEYFVSFELMITKHSSGWRTVLHLSKGKDNTAYGDRIPAVYVSPENKIDISSAVNGQKTRGFQYGPIDVNKWYLIQISQVVRDEGSAKVRMYFMHLTIFKNYSQYFYEIRIDGKLLRSEENKQPANFESVSVYAANPWSKLADGRIRNLFVSERKPPMTGKKVGLIASFVCFYDLVFTCHVSLRLKYSSVCRSS